MTTLVRPRDAWLWMDCTRECRIISGVRLLDGLENVYTISRIRWRRSWTKPASNAWPHSFGSTFVALMATGRLLASSLGLTTTMSVYWMSSTNLQIPTRMPKMWNELEILLAHGSSTWQATEKGPMRVDETVVKASTPLQLFPIARVTTLLWHGWRDGRHPHPDGHGITQSRHSRRASSRSSFRQPHGDAL